MPGSKGGICGDYTVIMRRREERNSVKNPYMEDFSHELVRVTQFFVPTAQSLQAERKAW